MSEFPAEATPEGSTEPGGDRWPSVADRARLHFVSGKGGTGKTTVAAALALALAAGGRKVLLIEVEERQGIAQLFDLPPLKSTETRIASAADGGEVFALAVDIEATFLEYLDMFYNLGFAGRAMRRVGAVDFATTIAPGLKDVLLTGKIKECVIRRDQDGTHTYDAVVVDAPPTGRIHTFLDVTRAMADLARGGPIRSQADGVVRLLHSAETAVHLVTLLEALPVQETVDAATDLQKAGMNLGAIIVNRSHRPLLPPEELAEAAEGRIDAARVESDLLSVGIELPAESFAGLLTEAIEHAATLQTQVTSAEGLAELDVPQLVLPELPDGMDIGGLYELAGLLLEEGVK